MLKTEEAQFEYAGHAMGLEFIPSGEEWHVETFSMSSREIEGGTYPKHFAEGEAVDAITNLTMNSKALDAGDLVDVKAMVAFAIRLLIANGTFQAVN